MLGRWRLKRERIILLDARNLSMNEPRTWVCHCSQSEGSCHDIAEGYAQRPVL